MTRQIGIWIDHKQAVLVILDGEAESILRVESEIGRHISFRGPTRPHVPYSAQYQKGEDRLDNQYEVHLNRYYEKVITQVRDAEAILILGPGEAKMELKKRLERKKSLAPLIEIEPADHLSDRQIAAKVRRHFAAQKVRS